MLKEKIFIPLNQDLIFKEMLCHEDNRDKLIYFLKSITKLDEKIITNNLIVYYESILNNTKIKDKSLRGDIIIKFDKYIINLESYSYFDNRSFEKSTNYIMRIFSTQLGKGKKYDCLESVIQINLVDNIRITFDHNIVSEYYLTNANNLEDKKLADKFIIKYYRIDKARKVPYNELDDEMRWIRFLGAKTQEERDKIAEGDELLMELNNWVEEFVNDEQTKKYYGEWAEAIAEEKGRVKEKEKIAKALKDKDFSIEEISDITKLSIEELKKL